ncbi:hypothetical protein [Psychrobacter sp. HII-4]|uniref:hypothetical protein n=1 Tax=Psychrobacter sp. HII-4 TaxID=1569264 RepID=UPI001918B740|nr:hypothetical protein [Psychrobacter sp. HII-4]
MHNHVTVGNDNLGNVCGGDLTINSMLPCKNGDGMLSFEDYQRMPYCNKCIGVSRYRNEQRFHFYSVFVGLVISALVMALHWIVTGGLPRFLLPMFEDNFLAPLAAPLLSTAMITVVILWLSTIIFKELADRYNNKYFSYHE